MREVKIECDVESGAVYDFLHIVENDDGSFEIRGDTSDEAIALSRLEAWRLANSLLRYFIRTNPNVYSCLVKARARIEHGWCQGEMAMNMTSNRLDSGTHWSALGAILSVGSAWSDAEEFFRNFHKIRESDWDTWNDSPDQTKERVLLAFDSAIEAAKKACFVCD